EARASFQYGTFSRLLSPFEGNYTAWQVVSPDQKEVFVGVYRGLLRVNEGNYRLYLRGLERDTFYRLDGDKVYSGASLMHAG
ncbi:GH36 C-terminal domain-containing protein, partial [Streptococcus pyogenes]